MTGLVKRNDIKEINLGAHSDSSIRKLKQELSNILTYLSFRLFAGQFVTF
jgi:hypothetical protein